MTQKTTNNDLSEAKLSVIFDATTAVLGIIGLLLSRFLFENYDSFVITSLVACAGVYNLADSHEQYIELIEERNKDI